MRWAKKGGCIVIHLNKIQCIMRCIFNFSRIPICGVFIMLFLLLFSCNQDKTEERSLDEKVRVEQLPVPKKNESVQSVFTELNEQEIRELAARGIAVVHDERAKTCRWSDDPDGSIYGEISCEGDCKVVACKPPSCQDPTICLGCFAPNLTHAGACRPKE